jgi:hypothetical protein
VTTRAARIEQFIVDADPPEGALTALLCEDHVGTYALPFPCRYSEGAWLNERTGGEIDLDVIGMREWRPVMIPARKQVT